MPAQAVIVLGVDSPIGLTIVRELGSRGMHVHGIARSRNSIGLHSRYLHRGYIRPLSEDALVTLIQELAERDNARFLLTVAESDILMLQRRARDLDGIKPLIPSPETMAKVLDKATTCRLAQQVEIAVPQSWEVKNAGEIAAVADRVRFPVVLKWSNPNEVSKALAAAGLDLIKAQYCHDRNELRAILERYSPINTYPLIQSFCPGYGLGQMVLMHKDRPILRFQHRRLHEWPPEGGFSTVCESLGLDQHAALFEKSVSLLRALDWAGPAMVEYRYDPVSDSAVLMEVNGRFWGSQPLAYHAGAHFAWYTYCALGLGEIPPPPRIKAGVRCRYMIPETRRLVRVLFRQDRIQDKRMRLSRAGELLSYASDFLRPGTRYYVFAWHDPLPFFQDLAGVFKKWRAFLRT